ncbi:4Fe-4S ferredoxin, partial [Rhizobiaceae sp. 2RAB30]
LDALLSRYPEARWHQWQPVTRDNVRKGAERAYGQMIETIPMLDRADVVLAIDSDLLDSAPGHLRFARDFAARRNPARSRKMSRLYAVEPTPSLTGAVADHRFIAGPRELHQALLTLAAGILQSSSPPSGAPSWVDAVITDLIASSGRALVHIGPHQSPEAHALVHAINDKLGAPGTTQKLVTPPIHMPADQAASLRDLVADMQSGNVTTLLILDSDPVYTAPATLGFAEALKRVPFSLALNATPNDTSFATGWGVPMAHPWESWSDARAYDGTATILQPQSLPLYQGMSIHLMVALLTEPAPPSALDIVRSTWKNRMGGDFETAWNDALADGVVSGTASTSANVSLRAEAGHQVPPAPPERPLTVLFRPDPHLWDGRHAGNPWLQELPRPLTKLTWDNPLLIAPEQARRLKVRNGDEVRLSMGNTQVTAPVWILPGQAQDCAVALL